MQQGTQYDLRGEFAPNPILVRGLLSQSPTVEGPALSLSTQQRTYLLRLPIDPVYVENIDGSEVLRYREADMAVGKIYRFKWYGEWYAALRSKEGVELLRFYPDEKWPRSRPTSAQFQES